MRLSYSFQLPRGGRLEKRGLAGRFHASGESGLASVRHVRRASFWQRDGPVNLPGQGRAGRPGGIGGFVARKLVIGDLRVQAVERDGRGRSFTIMWPDGAVHEAADRKICGYEFG